MQNTTRLGTRLGFENGRVAYRARVRRRAGMF